MSETAKIGVGIVAMALLAGATYLLVKNNEAKAPAAENPTYRSAQYGYSFSYDSAYTLVESTPEYVTLEDPGSAEPNEIVEVAVVTADLVMDQSDNFEEFAKERAKMFCAADGPGGSLYCTRTSRSQDFTAATGVRGEIFYLEMVHETPEGKTTREAGPFYAFNVSKDSPGSGYSALVFRPARFYEEGDMYDEGAKIANDIVNTLRIEQE